jgi:hypothetical protein
VLDLRAASRAAETSLFADITRHSRGKPSGPTFARRTQIETLSVSLDSFTEPEQEFDVGVKSQTSARSTLGEDVESRR